MKQYIHFYLLALILLTLSVNAQKIENVYFKVQDKKIIVSYDLTNCPDNYQYDISLKFKYNTGEVVVPMNATGDLASVEPGKYKTVNWDVLADKQEIKGNICAIIEIANTKSSRKSYEPEMVEVQGGTFTMGDGSYNDHPAYSVTVSSFKMGIYDITQAQWQAVMNNNPSDFKGCDNCPVEQVSWDDTQNYINKLNQQTGKHYRLPTEAEWEFAARGGKKSKSYSYSGSNEISSIAWYSVNCSDYSSKKTHPVGQKLPNELGIYDMTGNVWQWCNDWYGSDYYYTGSHPNDPKGPETGQLRVLRGGSWNSSNTDCLIFNRGNFFPEVRRFINGFRVVLSD